MIFCFEFDTLTINDSRNVISKYIKGNQLLEANYIVYFLYTCLPCNFKPQMT